MLLQVHSEALLQRAGLSGVNSARLLSFFEDAHNDFIEVYSGICGVGLQMLETRHVIAVAQHQRLSCMRDCRAAWWQHLWLAIKLDVCLLKKTHLKPLTLSQILPMRNSRFDLAQMHRPIHTYDLNRFIIVILLTMFPI